MSKKRYRISFSSVSIEDLVKMKRQGALIRKLIYGLTPEEYGHVYSVNGYRTTCNADPKKISEALRKTKRGSSKLHVEDDEGWERLI